MQGGKLPCRRTHGARRLQEPQRFQVAVQRVGRHTVGGLVRTNVQRAAGAGLVRCQEDATGVPRVDLVIDRKQPDPRRSFWPTGAIVVVERNCDPVLDWGEVEPGVPGFVVEPEQLFRGVGAGQQATAGPEIPNLGGGGPVAEDNATHHRIHA